MRWTAADGIEVEYDELEDLFRVRSGVPGKPDVITPERNVHAYMLLSSLMQELE